jgi:hypothetical protein
LTGINNYGLWLVGLTTVVFRIKDKTLTRVRPQMVDFGPEQGLSDFETGGVAGYVERA